MGPSRAAYPSEDGSGPGLPSSSRVVPLELVERLEERCGGLTVENKGLKGQVERLTGQLAALRRELEGVRRELEAAVAAGGFMHQRMDVRLAFGGTDCAGVAALCTLLYGTPCAQGFPGADGGG